jgi:hypothetical protein
LTLLLQSAGASGLQALAPDGATWLEVPPLPGTLVLNLGELLQLASGGYYRATVHRVVPPRGDAARLSAPFFYNADYDHRIAKPLDMPPDLPWTVRCIREAAGAAGADMCARFAVTVCSVRGRCGWPPPTRMRGATRCCRARAITCSNRTRARTPQHSRQTTRTCASGLTAPWCRAAAAEK